LATALLSPGASAQQFTINTFAGGGPNHAQATTVALGFTENVVTDSNGNLYFSDSSLHRVYKVDNTNVMTVIAGYGMPDSSGDGGQGVSAGLNGPRGLAIDSSNNLYIADTGNNKVRRISLASGIITTFAGNGTAGATGDGSAASGAALRTPVAVALDSTGSVYISDQGNYKIRRVDNTGIITTFAGTGANGFFGDGTSAAGAQFSTATGIAFDSAGNNLIVADSGNNRVRRISLTGANIIQTIVNQTIGTAGFSGDSTSAFGAQLNNPVDVFVDGSGNLYITDAGNFRIRKVPLTAGNPGNISSIIGSANGTGNPLGDGGPATSASLNGPRGVTVSAGGTIYVADRGDGRIRVVTNGNINTLAGNGGALPLFGGDGFQAVDALINQPYGESVDSQGNVYICDWGNNRVRRVDTSGVITTIAGTGTQGSAGDGGAATSAQLNGPAGSAIDSQGNIYIAEYGGHRIRVIRNGIISTYAGNGAAGYSGDNGQAALAKVNFPLGLAVDGNNNLYIADSANNVVRKIAFSSQIITTIVGNGPPILAGYGGDGASPTGPNAKLNRPTGLAVNNAGTVLYIADQNNNRVRWVSNSVLNTFAGTGVGTFGGDGLAANQANLNFASGVMLDQTTNRLYILDFNNNRVRLVAADSPNNIISTVAGSAARGFGGDGGSATSALLANPFSATIDANGRVYIGDQFNNRVRSLALVCNYILGQTGTGVGAAGGGPFNVSVTAPTGCPWTVTLGTGNFLTITGGVNSNGSGTASFSVSANQSSTQRVGTLIIAGQTYTVTQSGDTPSSIVAVQGSGQTARINTGFGTALQALVNDAGGNPLAGVTVTFTAPSSGASGTFAGGGATAVTTSNAQGLATAPAFTANSVAGSYGVTVAASGVSTPATYSLTNLTGGVVSQSRIGIFNSTQSVFLLDSNGNYAWDGSATDLFFPWGTGNHNPKYIVVVGDWNGSGTKKVGIFDPGTATWLLDYNGDGVYTPGIDKYFMWGSPGDTPVVGDWNGSGTTKIGTYGPTTGLWLLDYNGNYNWDGGGTDRYFPWGSPGDTPVVGDWNGSGTTKVGVYGPNTGLWLLDYNGNFAWDGPGVDKYFSWGSAGDTPIVGNWNGSGSAKVGTFGPRTGLWLLDYNGNFSWDGPGTDRYFPWGSGGDTPVTGDWNGNGTTKVGTFGPGTSLWLLDYNGNFSWDGPAVDKYFPWGSPGDTPVILK
jgi:DNA-binding beta-propeller fold protein YncE